MQSSVRSDLVLPINVYIPDDNFHQTKRFQNITGTSQT